MANSINYDNYPPVIHYMGYEYIGGAIQEAAKDDGILYMSPTFINFGCTVLMGELTQISLQ